MKKEKHNHKLTNLLKVVIFGIIMIAPFFAVLSKTLYITFNPNAQDSYADYYSSTQVAVSGNSLEQINNNYSINLKTFTDYAQNTNVGYIKLGNGRFKYTDLSINWNDYKPSNSPNLTDAQLQTINNVCIYIGNLTNQKLILKFYQDNTAIATWYYSTIPNKIKNTIYFTLVDLPTFSEGSYASNYNSKSMYMITYTIDKLDNAFYYAIDELNEQPIFNWAKDTAIYNALNSFTTGITGTTNSTLALLLAYWFIITAIYIVIDIIIFAFTYLTHFFNN